ncbi:unnamed protein product, partial [Porites lobata]
MNGMEQHLKHMKHLTNRLAAIGAPISEEDQVVTLLGSLLRNFASLVTAMQATTNFVQQALRHVKMKQTEMSHSLRKAESVLSGVTTKNKPRGPPTCVDCAEVGYICRYCTSNKSKGQKARLAEGQDVR